MDVQRLIAYSKRFLRDYRDYKTRWNYEDGCTLTGVRYLYDAAGDSLFRDYILSYLDRRIASNGAIPSYPSEGQQLDSFNAGKLLFFALDETGEERYRRALDFLMDELKRHPRCGNGSFWHKDIYPDQIWLDGLYMLEPLYAEYETRFGGEEHYSDILLQFQNARTFLCDEEKHLFYHAYDEAKQQPWADPETGHSPNFWSRAEGWFLMALTDTYEKLDPRVYEIRRYLSDLLDYSLDGILRYRSREDGLIYQVIDRADIPENYTETSGSAMCAYAVMKGCRLGMIQEEKYLAAGKELFEDLVRAKFSSDEKGVDHLYDTCEVAGLGPGDRRNGSVEYYLSEKRAVDEAKGVGPLMMALSEYTRL